MAAFKNEKNGTWFVQFRYTDWKGERQQKFKRGFATKKEAQEWEREFLMRLNVRAGRLAAEYHIRYENSRSHAGRSITLTLEPPQA